MAQNILVLNMGMKSIRCIIFDALGRKLSSASKPISSAINDNTVEQNPVEWWTKATQVMSKAIYDSGIKHIDYITVTTSASCLVCIDSKGKALGKAIMVSDKRAIAESTEISSLPQFHNILNATGLKMSPSLMLPKILWLKHHIPENFENAEYFLTPNDFLIYMLTGAITTDYLNALKYHYNATTRSYPQELLDVLGISDKKFPEVVEIGYKIGKIKDSVAKTVNMNSDAKVIISSYDAICSFIGSGVTEEGETSDVSGTVTVFRTLSKRNMMSNNSQVYSMPFYQEGFNIVGGSNNLGGGLIEWVKQCYYTKEEYPYEVMQKEAGESELGARGIIFLPYLLGERAPLWNDEARGIFFGLERMHTRKDMTRAVFESTGFIDKSFEEAIKATGIEISSVRISGGLARLNLISQIKADILGKEVIVLSEFETTALGAAMMVFCTQGIFDSLKEAASRFVKVRMIIKPNSENHKKYNLMYDLYKDTYETNKDLFEKRIKILESIRTNKETRIENL